MMLLMSVAQAETVMGLEWVPFSRGDMAWLEEGMASGTLVGELDGWLRPAATFHAGWAWGRHALLGDVAVARLTHTTWSGDDYSQIHVGAARLAADYRYYLREWQPQAVSVWLSGGVYGIIPSARVVSTSYTDSEQADADEGASATRQSIGGAGGRLGPGFAYTFTPALSLGARYHLVLYWGHSLTEQALSTSVAVYSEAAVVFEVRL